MIDEGTGMKPPVNKESESNHDNGMPDYEPMARSTLTSVDVKDMLTMMSEWLDKRLAALESSVEENRSMLKEIMRRIEECEDD